MPKIDMNKVPVDTSTGYRAPFNKAVQGRSRRRLGRAAGLTQFGFNVCTLKPGAASSLRHYQQNEDELVYVLEGEVTLCEDDGETVLRPGDCVAWKAGATNGHCMVNKSGRDVVFIEVGYRAETEKAVYPDIDMIAVREGTTFRYLKKNGEPYPA